MLPLLRTTIAIMFGSLALAPAAGAWTWPASGPVLQLFSVDDNPYAGGQHRGVDIGAAAGEPVLAPRAGRIVFAGSMPTHGLSITIQTDDGYSVTLVHLGAIGVRKNAQVTEGDSIGTIGVSGEVEHPVPYVHLGVRLTPDPNG
jgi:murein DD-endopeptidase MepM/ murein hydrolase activator NlpD